MILRHIRKPRPSHGRGGARDHLWCGSALPCTGLSIHVLNLEISPLHCNCMAKPSNPVMGLPNF